MSDPRQRSASKDDDAAAVAEAPSYSEYLKLPALLALQAPLAQPAVHDEMLFIIVHQTHELWFKQILCELSLLISDIDVRSFDTACRTLDRITRIARLLVEHMQVLETMSPHEFQRFRSVLGTASGLESEQFQRLEALAGSLDEAPRAIALDGAPSVSVREAFWRSLAAVQSGTGMPRGGSADASALGRALAGWLALPAFAAHRALAEALLVFDETIVSWRRGHFEIARRMIGSAAGTGGSSGAAYLRATMDRCFFPELWQWQRSRPDPVPAA